MLNLELAKEIFKEFTGKATWEQFVYLLENSRVFEYSWGVLVLVGRDIHIHVLKKYQKKVLLRKAFKEVVIPALQEFGYLTTVVPKDNEIALAFDKRIGFKVVGEDSENWKLKLLKEDFKYHGS